MAPQLIFGTASFGMDMTEFQDQAAVSNLLDTLYELGIYRLDTAARYPPLNPGRSEELIGQVEQSKGKFIIDTKVSTDTRRDGSGDLARDAMKSSFTASLARLKLGKVNVLHAHRADPSTSLEEQIRAFNEQVNSGHCKAWGVSNVPPAMLEDILSICDQKGLIKPSCYQGDYNLLTRGMEKKLLPILRKHGMTFNAFRPLAAGFLNGKFINNNHSGTRFDAQNNPIGQMVQKLYGADDLVSAMRKFDQGVTSQGSTPLEVAIRWITYHSALGDTDGIILGASKTSQIVETVAMVKKGPLSEDVLQIAERLWTELEETRRDII